MARQAQDLLEQVSKIGRTNASLGDELLVLEKNMDKLNHNAESSLELPNKILAQLTSLLDISALEDVPQIEQGSSWWILFWPKRSPESLLKSSVASITSNLVQVERIAEATAQESNKCQLRAAHLAHDAAVQEDVCGTSLGQLSLAQQRAQQQLNEFTTKTSSIQSAMALGRRMKEFMEAEMQDHGERAENHSKVSTLFYIERKLVRSSNLTPQVAQAYVVDPWAESGNSTCDCYKKMHHRKEVDECEDTVDSLNEGLTTLESSTEKLEAQITTILEVQDQLEKATTSCTDIGIQSKRQINEAKKLVDQFQGISARSSDVREALMLFQNRNDLQSSQDIRLKILRSVVELSRHLLDHNLLAEGQKTSTIRLAQAHERASQNLEDQDIIASVSAYNLPLLDDF